MSKILNFVKISFIETAKLTAAVLIIVIVCFVMRLDLIELLHNKLIFYPTREIFSVLNNKDINYEDVYIDTLDDEKLHGYFFYPKIKTNKVVIFFHGNGLNISAGYHLPYEISKKAGVNILYPDYRGYGKSTGKPTVKDVIIDVQEIYEYLISKGFKGENISLYGESLGGALALELAIRKKVKSIVVQSSFTSLRDIAADKYPFIPSFIVENRFLNSKTIVQKLSVPVLFIHGTDDEIVHLKHSEKLYELANEPKKLIILEGAGHYGIYKYLNDEHFKILKDLFL